MRLDHLQVVAATTAARRQGADHQEQPRRLQKQSLWLQEGHPLVGLAGAAEEVVAWFLLSKQACPASTLPI